MAENTNKDMAFSLTLNYKEALKGIQEYKKKVVELIEAQKKLCEAFDQGAKSEKAFKTESVEVAKALKNCLDNAAELKNEIQSNISTTLAASAKVATESVSLLKDAFTEEAMSPLVEAIELYKEWGAEKGDILKAFGDKMEANAKTFKDEWGDTLKEIETEFKRVFKDEAPAKFNEFTKELLKGKDAIVEGFEDVFKNGKLKDIALEKFNDLTKDLLKEKDNIVKEFEDLYKNVFKNGKLEDITLEKFNKFAKDLLTGKDNIVKEFESLYKDVFKNGKLEDIALDKFKEFAQNLLKGKGDVVKEIEQLYKDIFKDNKLENMALDKFNEFAQSLLKGKAEIGKEIEQLYNDIFKDNKLEDIAKEKFNEYVKGLLKGKGEIGKEIENLYNNVFKGSKLEDKALSKFNDFTKDLLKGKDNIAKEVENLYNKVFKDNKLENKAIEQVNNFVQDLLKGKGNIVKGAEDLYNGIFKKDKTKDSTSQESNGSVQGDIDNIDPAGKLDILKKESLDELQIKLDQLALQEQAEIDSAEKTGADVALIREKYAQQKQEQETEQQISDVESQKLENEIRTEEMILDLENTTALKVEAKLAELETLNEIDEENDEYVAERQVELSERLKEREEEEQATRIEGLDGYLASAQNMAAGFTELLQGIAGESAAMAEFAKVMALFQIGLDTARALVAGIAAAQAVPFPGNLIAIVSTTAAVLTNVAKAKKYLTSGEKPSAPSFATGGLVTGAGSGTSDSITARLSNGESVMTALTTSMFAPVLSAFNQIGGGVPLSTQGTAGQILGEEMLSRSFAKAIKRMPAPVVSVREINTVNSQNEKNVKAYEL